MTQKIYTKTGDEGKTGLFGGGRVSKANRRVNAYGEVDELNAVIGWVIAESDHDALKERLTFLQSDLFSIGAHLATPDGARTHVHLPALPEARIGEMESWIDEAETSLPELKAFILPGGSRSAAALHVARTVCRRAERAVVDLEAHESVNPGILVYLNRLSDLLFVLARAENARAGVAEPKWQP
ncbi:MAG TPA: cob(I)yrinic acid a,c-diamide adenosyltransferase [Longimicrobiales bacterium]